MILVLVILILLVVVLFFAFRPYIVKGLLMSVKSGRLGPAINEMAAFKNRIIRKQKPEPWAHSIDLENSHLSSEALEKLEILDTTAFLVIRNRKICFEKYWQPFDKDTISNSFSVAKSIVATLIGIAIRKRLIHLDDPVASYIPSFQTPPKDRITIRHLLQMSSGLKWIESEGSALSHNAEAYYGENLLTLIDKLEVRRPAGEVFRYASGNTQILAMVIAQASKMTLSEFASQELWSPIRAEHDAWWNLDHKDGMEKAFCCFYATPRDFARVGQLYLNDGQWGNQSILEPAFIREALSPVLLPDIWLNRPNDIYGMHWWLVRHRGYDFFYARGIRGQYIICNKQLELIIVRMGHKRNPVDRQHGHPPDLFDHINAGLEIIMPNPQ
jgi:CubicO group peptidase (beta-lactamase class C family)